MVLSFGRFVFLMVGLSDIAKYDQYGEEESDVEFPFRLFFSPNPQLTLRFHDQPATLEGIYDQLISIPSDIKLWDVYASSHPEDTNHVKIAELISASEVVFSETGDTNIFFRHQFMQEDIDLHPEWYEDKTTEEDNGNCKLFCPFSFDRNPQKYFGL